MKRMILLCFALLTFAFVLTACSDDGTENVAASGSLQSSASFERTEEKTDIPEEKPQDIVDDDIYSYKDIPSDYMNPATEQGSITRLDYKTTNAAGEEISKYAYVYLPYGYDHDDDSVKYNIFYLMHGGSGSPETWFGGSSVNSRLKNILDQMIERKDMEPLIVVTPTYYTDGNVTQNSINGEGKQTELFQTELANDLIPKVDTEFHTYSNGTDTDSLKAARFHRAFGGYSMGSVATWYAFIHNLDYIAYFMPMSGDCWVYGTMGGGNRPKDTAKYLHDVVVNSGYHTDEYYIYGSVGAKGVAYEPMNSQVEAMREYADTFIETDNFANGNFHFDIAIDGTHDYGYGYHYIYNALPNFFGRNS